ncbi:TetR/AcrR family transcriptional regulator [Arcanobacterium canis]|uniref:TetR/AcrR family transcriptional regulator n=1 Tax=Arcanobacterium canis TaxID=999183 RepID=A0ABY8G2C1_9ACTO|nr:TetR/AcrR family transcriptional regulator [Arcanobacterium canis]WFM83534.1 TetR/AcrR family transcriptional regulator [Arcanobacterium canis]
MPKIIGSNLAEHRERTRDALFGALQRLMEERGFDGITMSDLAREAGIGRTAIYNHVHDKEDLLMEFVAHEISVYVENVQKSLATTANPIDQLRIFVRSQLLQERAYLRAPGPPLIQVVSPETAHQMGKHIAQSSKILRGIIHACINNGLAPQQDVGIAITLINGALTGRRIPKEEPERSMFFDAAERFVVRAIGADADGKLTDLGPIPACSW